MCAIQLNMTPEDEQDDKMIGRSRRNLKKFTKAYNTTTKPIQRKRSKARQQQEQEGESSRRVVVDDDGVGGSGRDGGGRRGRMDEVERVVVPPRRRARDFFKWGHKRRQILNAELYRDVSGVDGDEGVGGGGFRNGVGGGGGGGGKGGGGVVAFGGRARFRYGNPDLVVTGWLSKRGRSLGRRVERYVELRGSTLSNRRREGGEPTWTVNVRGCQVLVGPGREIVIKVAKEWMSLYAGSDGSHEMWLNALRSVSTSVADFYDFGNMIGKGAYSEVLLAKDKNRNELCAVKVLERSDIEHERLIDRELLVLKKLAHPNIVQVIDVFDSSKETYVVMEYLAGGELLDMITEHDHLSERNARLVIKEVLEAVEYLHDNNVVHRDIKPENILCVNRSWPLRVKITDFGLSKVLGRGASDRVMRSQCGTAYYLAPEVANREKYGKPVDLWACGVVLYVMLAGKFPFYGDTDEKFMRRLRNGVKFPDKEWRNISPAAKALIKGLLDPNPSTRLTARGALQHRWITGNDSEGLTSSSRPAQAADQSRRNAQTQFNAHNEPMSLQLTSFIPHSIRKRNASRAVEFCDVDDVLRTDDATNGFKRPKAFEI